MSAKNDNKDASAHDNEEGVRYREHVGYVILDAANDGLYKDDTFYTDAKVEFAVAKDPSPGRDASSVTASTWSGPSQAETAEESFKKFEQIDIVYDFPDHPLAEQHQQQFQQVERSRNWEKAIQNEWKNLQLNLPETIFVRVCESRIGLMRVVIIGAPHTPYHDGLFFFDCLFPPTYPAVPPILVYRSRGLRLNPNLYWDGYVCISLLGKQHGDRTGKWIPKKSTMLQVLVAIWDLILNEKPFFNEPRNDVKYIGTSSGDAESRSYNEIVFLMSLRTMVYSLIRPPKHFEDFVVAHLWERVSDIRITCSEYTSGARVGSVVVRDGVAVADQGIRFASLEFTMELIKVTYVLARVLNQILKQFSFHHP